jgi:hypothetical protein
LTYHLCSVTTRVCGCSLLPRQSRPSPLLPGTQWPHETNFTRERCMLLGSTLQGSCSSVRSLGSTELAARKENVEKERFLVVEKAWRLCGDKGRHR